MNKRTAFVTATVFATAFAAAVPAVAQVAQTSETTETTTVTTTKTEPRKYVYYGEHDIYFAPATKTYYWKEGPEWRSGAELPAASRTYVTTGGVTIELDTDKPYERNDWVIENYRKRP
jgi:hypothetical protein